MLNCLMVNRGSTGFGEAALRTLPGNVGSHDVTDCIAALDAVVSLGAYVDTFPCLFAQMHRRRSFSSCTMLIHRLMQGPRVQ